MLYMLLEKMCEKQGKEDEKDTFKMKSRNIERGCLFQIQEYFKDQVIPKIAQGKISGIKPTLKSSKSL